MSLYCYNVWGTNKLTEHKVVVGNPAFLRSLGTLLVFLIHLEVNNFFQAYDSCEVLVSARVLETSEEHTESTQHLKVRVLGHQTDKAAVNKILAQSEQINAWDSSASHKGGCVKFFSIKAGKVSSGLNICRFPPRSSTEQFRFTFLCAYTSLIQSSLPKSCEASKTQVGVKGLKRGLINYCWQ